MELEEAIKEFHALVKELENSPSLTAETALARVLHFYRETRITNTKLESDDDMLLLQWGVTNPFTTDVPIDMRNLADDQIWFEEIKQRYLDFTRQVFQSGTDADAEFDVEAIQMSLTLLYGTASGNEKSANQWITQPDQIEDAMQDYCQNDFVKQHFELPVIRLCASVFHCG